MRRPVGVTVLATLNFFGALCYFALGLATLFASRSLTTLLLWFADTRPFDPSGREFGWRLAVAVACACGGLLLFVYARGFWRLKNWARVVCIFFSILNLADTGSGDALLPVPYLLSHKLAPALWPHSDFLISGMLGVLLSRLASVVVLVYLFRSPVRAAFRANPAEWKWITAVAALTFLMAGRSLYKSRPELEAIRWHARHGDQVVVNGVTFPIYYWHVPTVYANNSGFRVDDRPGPLRPDHEDTYTAISVLGCKEDENNLTPQQLVDQKLQSYRRTGYKNLTTFPLRIAKQTLDCMNENEFGYGGATYCYGDGPIYSVFFAGDTTSIRIHDGRREVVRRVRQPLESGFWFQISGCSTLAVFEAAMF